MSTYNPAQNVFTSGGTGVSSVNQYYDVKITDPRAHNMFSRPIVENSPYSVGTVTIDMLTRLEVYTSAVLAGDMKAINQDYMYAIQAVIYTLKRAKTRLDDKLIEELWSKATIMEGNVIENYTKELMYRIGLER